MVCAHYFFVKLTKHRVMWEEGSLRDELPPSDEPVGKCVVIFLINDDVGMPSPVWAVPRLSRWLWAV